ncbi:DUF2937 family protein [Alteromonas sp. ASW11-130]|uniref:DUF2937 family protein n=1 Tax=Alteromonas sp. ASW11-130 TaxID=3015775 RepID=UPI0022427116|nr:DUF2937 family protein [Alteromonas sp. ASW11-130]MCW8091363.1 DUF2937 family protein [Alteromonas sp. ASW11-130]
MTLFVRVLDKILFATLLLVALQVPILADHYRQYLTGYYDATAAQVEEYKALSVRHGYTHLEDMLAELEKSSNPVVRDDTQNKVNTLAMLKELNEGIRVLNRGHYYQQAWYMLSPSQNETLRRVLDNFHPSIPLSPEAVVFSLISAIIINVIMWAPYWTAVKLKQWRHNRKYHPAGTT